MVYAVSPHAPTYLRLPLMSVRRLRCAALGSRRVAAAMAPAASLHTGLKSCALSRATPSTRHSPAGLFLCMGAALTATAATSSMTCTHQHSPWLTAVSASALGLRDFCRMGGVLLRLLRSSDGFVMMIHMGWCMPACCASYSHTTASPSWGLTPCCPRRAIMLDVQHSLASTPVRRAWASGCWRTVCVLRLQTKRRFCPGLPRCVTAWVSRLTSRRAHMACCAALCTQWCLDAHLCLHGCGYACGGTPS